MPCLTMCQILRFHEDCRITSSRSRREAALESRYRSKAALEDESSSSMNEDSSFLLMASILDRRPLKLVR